MSQMGKITFGPGFEHFDRFFVGYDEQFDKLNKLVSMSKKTSSNYPPHNVIRTGEFTYIIELAVAGFSETEISVEIKDQTLIITGSAIDALEDTQDYIWKGIAKRAFVREFPLAEYIEVRGAEMHNGLLRIQLEQNVPDHKKPQKIEVKTKGSPDLLLG